MVEQLPAQLQLLESNFELQARTAVHLLKLHGDLGDWRRVVLSSASYREFHLVQPLLSRQLDLSLRVRPAVFVGCSLTDPRLLDWLRGLPLADRRRLYASRALLTTQAWTSLPAATQELLTSANLKPILLPDHSAVADLLAELVRRLAPRIRRSWSAT